MTTPDPDALPNPSFVRWNSIELLHNVVRTLEFLAEQGSPMPTQKYRAKIKLHGTNAAIQCTANGPIAQSRSKVLTGHQDNCGFAAWVATHHTVLASIEPPCTVFGEWCGPGVQSGMAISMLDRKIFAVFAVQEGTGDQAVLEVCPKAIAERLPKHPDLFVIPWFGPELTLSFGGDLSEAVQTINTMVEEIEHEDPWVKDIFGLSGMGEGMVLYPQQEGVLTNETFSTLGFKAKGLKHRTVATKKSAQVKPEVAAGVSEFVAMHLTEARLVQGVSETCDGSPSMKQMGEFIRWVVTDVKKESVSELEAAKLSWKQVSKQVSTNARDWFRKQCESILTEKPS